MSIMQAMYNGVSGMSAQSKSLNAISQNIANVNTVGYKGARTEFETLLGGWSNGGSISGGVRAAPQSMVSQQGQLQGTDSATDIAIDGDGFFVVQSQGADGKAGETLFTRAGAFSVDAKGNLTNTGNDVLMGWKLDGQGNAIGANNGTSTAGLQAINVAGMSYAAQPTTAASITANLSADNKVGSTYNSTIEVYDSLGAGHTLALGFERAQQVDLAGALDPANPPAAQTVNVTKPDGTTATLTLNFANGGNGSWTLTPAVAGASVTSGTVPLAFDARGALTGDGSREMTIDWGDGSASHVSLDLASLTAGTGTPAATVDANTVYRMTAGTGSAADTVTAGAVTYVSFDANGRLVSPAKTNIGIDWSDAASNAANATISLTLGTPGASDGLSALSGVNTVRATTQDGLAAGAFTGVAIDKSGNVVAQFDNGQSRAVYRIPVAQFVNPDGLEAVSGNAYRASSDAGALTLNASGSGGAGTINGKSLEGSTVDIAAEFSSMIITQRAYSANATVITTADEMLKALDQLKR